jgi:hypothetical protein
VGKDGRTIDLRFLRCRPRDGTWELSESNGWPAFPHAPAGAPITHLAWAVTSSPELAVIDAVGRISILSFSITLNHPYLVKKWHADTADDLHAVVGCYWLPLALINRQASGLDLTCPVLSCVALFSCPVVSIRSTPYVALLCGCKTNTNTRTQPRRLLVPATPTQARAPSCVSPPTAY